MSPVTNPKFFCSRASAAADEQLFGTASRGEVWFLLEYRTPWEAESFAASALPAPIKDRITTYLKTIPGSRLHFIKHQRHKDAYLNLFVALTGEIEPRIYKFRLETYADLLSLDFYSLADNPVEFSGYIYKHPLYLTCTHGKHDKCCAKFGRPIASALSEQVGLNAWHSSHLGGDRFAANLGCFPHGVYYGRVQPEEVETILNHDRQGKVYLEKLRGRVCYNFLTQAGDYYLRRETGILELAAFRYLGNSHLPEKNRRALQFQHLTTRQTHTVILQKGPEVVRNYFTCTALKESNAPQYQLISHEVE